MKQSSIFNAGDWVTVRSAREILATLDENAQLEGMPFMPQMLAYCDKRFRVWKRAHKTCDTALSLGPRKLENAVHLENLRCDGQAYGGCQQMCLLYWKDAWLRPADAPAAGHPEPAAVASTNPVCTESRVWSATVRSDGTSANPLYVCQATQLPHVTTALSMWDVRQYYEDVTSGNARFVRMIYPLFFFLYHSVATSGLGIGSAMRWVYDLIQQLRGGLLYPWRKPRISKGQRTPTQVLDIQEGETVRVKSYDQILGTIDTDYKNRGMAFHAELVPYCGKTLKVIKRIERIIDEKSGRLVVLKNPCIVVEKTECEGVYGKPLFCPRGCYAYWREIWLERPDQSDALSSPLNSQDDREGRETGAGIETSSAAVHNL
jgi:hypothetical protein